MAVWLLETVPLSGAEEPSKQESPSSGPSQLGDQTSKRLARLNLLKELLDQEITPVNVLGSHMHLKGEWMAGYRYMFMHMQGNLDGTREVSEAEVLRQGFGVVHTKMTMQMHMAELMYAPSDDLTLMGMVPYKQMDMDHLNRRGVAYTTHSDGLGDLNLMALYNIYGSVRKHGSRVLLNGGFIFPTGSTDARYRTPSNPNALLEYPMQLGSGTFGFEPGVTYLGESENWAWGGQVIGTVRVGKNDRGYRLGNEYRVSAWSYYKVTDWFGPSLRLDWHDWENVHGKDPELNPATNPAFDAHEQEGQRLDFLMGLNFYLSKGMLNGNRFSIEGGVPVYQSLAGPNLGTDWLITAGWSYTF